MSSNTRYGHTNVSWVPHRECVCGGGVLRASVHFEERERDFIARHEIFIIFDQQIIAGSLIKLNIVFFVVLKKILLYFTQQDMLYRLVRLTGINCTNLAVGKPELTSTCPDMKTKIRLLTTWIVLWIVVCCRVVVTEQDLFVTIIKDKLVISLSQRQNSLHQPKILLKERHYWSGGYLNCLHYVWFLETNQSHGTCFQTPSFHKPFQFL